MAQKKIILKELGVIPYQEAWDYQEKLLHKGVQQKIKAQNEAKIDNVLLICTHPHVYTLGKHGDFEHLLLNNKQLEEQGIGFYKTNRGGDITYHGPGQLIAYPILDLEQFGSNIRAYLHALEEVVIRTIAEFGIKADRLEGKTGVWIEPQSKNARKICAIGVRCSRWITIHGLALNINTDLSYFNGIIPCGIADKSVAGMSQELNKKIDEAKVIAVFIEKFSEVFEAEIVAETTVS